MAHQDDDLLFMSPDLEKDYQRGNCLKIVYLTAGDGGEGALFYESREDGVRAAYSLLAGVPDAWQNERVRLDGHRIRTSRLTVPSGRPDIEVTFMRLPDGFERGQGSAAGRYQSLQKLFDGRIPDITAIDGSATYTEHSLVRTLRTIIGTPRPDMVRTLDYDNTRLGRSIEPGADHSDHSVAARFVRIAEMADLTQGGPGGRRPVPLIAYRGYAIDQLPQNLSPALEQRKAQLYLAYFRHEGCRPADCPPQPPPVLPSYPAWWAREYHRTPPAVAPGALVSWIGSNTAPNTDDDTGRCLDASASPGADPRQVRTAACDGGAAQNWSTGGGTLRDKATGRCLTVGATVTTARCDGRPEQRWRLDRLGRISAYGPENPASGQCLTQDDLLKTSPALHRRPCDEDEPGQRWYSHPT
ncbi:ricin-type beta-trefoil lectin domain protein [Streptomyces sp. NPDC050617]|uniref:ricin-type beta-trefoil lectin domain protein n=1 Tax=Streptomyces sp. NPDC050617 TaxID=3154628 RepID=UPI00343A30EA